MNAFRCCVLLVLALTLCNVHALTYRQLLDFIQENDDDPENAFEIEDDPTVDNTTIVVKDLDQEVDGTYLLYKLAGEYLGNTDVSEIGPKRNIKEGLGFWRRRRRRHRRRRRRQICSCHRDGCTCCAKKRFSVKIVFKRISKTLSVCVEVNYLPKNFGFEFVLKLNGRRVFRHEISLKHPPQLCYKVPGFGSFARVCAEIYNVNIARKSLCVRAVGVLDIKIKKFKVNLKIACFKIPILDENVLSWLEEAQNQADYLELDDLPFLGNDDVYRMMIEEFEN